MALGFWIHWFLFLLIQSGCIDKNGDGGSFGWCTERCKSLSELAVNESVGGADPEEYEAGCEDLDTRSCDECHRVLGEYLMEYGIFSDCYCVVGPAQRDEEIAPGGECEHIIEEYYGGDLSELEDTCACD